MRASSPCREIFTCITVRKRIGQEALTSSLNHLGVECTADGEIEAGIDECQAERILPINPYSVENNAMTPILTFSRGARAGFSSWVAAEGHGDLGRPRLPADTPANGARTA